MLVAVGTELFQFQASCRVAAIFAGSIAGNAGRSLVGIAATLGTL